MTKYILLIMASLFGLSGVSSGQELWKQYARLNHRIGESSDRYYREAGERVDIAVEDLRELKRQGKEYPADLLSEAERASKEISRRWLKIERERLKLKRDSANVSTPGSYILEIENISKANAWFGLRWAKIKFAGGKKLTLPAKRFKGGRFISGYDFRCKPADAMFVYPDAKRSQMRIEISPKEISHPARAWLILSGLDCDLPVKSVIRIMFNGIELFRGENPFVKNRWSEKTFKISGRMLEASNSADEAEKLQQRGKGILDEVETFGSWAMKLAEDIDSKTLPFRKNIQYTPIAGPEKTHFLRGICFHGKNGMVRDRSDKDHLPYKMMDFEYQAKAMRGIGANLIYSDIYSHAAREAALETFCRVGLPFTQVGRRNFGHERDIRFNYYYTHHKQWLSDLKRWLGRWMKPYPMFWAVGIDEPVIMNKPAILDSPVVQSKFAEYLQTRKALLKASGIRIPDKPDLRKIQEGKFGKVIWMEFQMFKTKFMADQYRWLNEQCESLGTRTLPIIMTHNHYFAQECSWVALGKVLPRMSTDLYRNGRLFEGFNLQLFRSAVDGTAWMTPGSGWSCKTADHFRRSLAISMLYGDGVLQWTNLYCSKYRGPLYFWRGDGTQPADETVRNMWSWEYWPVMQNMYQQMKQADKYLAIRNSANDVILLFSERESILGTFKKPERYFISPYFYENLHIYSDLIRNGISSDVGFLETAERKGLSQYKVAVLSAAKSITPHQEQVLRDWVRQGGTLIVSADTADCDQWGRKSESYSLADVFGIEKQTGSGKGTYFRAMSQKVSFKPPQKFAKIELAKQNPATIIGRWNNGLPALLRHRFGKGQVLFFTANSIAARLAKSSGKGGLPGESERGLANLLCRIIKKNKSPQPIQVLGLPEGIEVQIRRRGNTYVVHLLDWYDGRNLRGHLEIRIPGLWKVFYAFGARRERILHANEKYELRPFRIHDMIVVQPLPASSQAE